MRIGLIARAERAAGLAVHTWEFARHLQPAVIAVVARDVERGGVDFERYDGLASTVFRSGYGWTEHDEIVEAFADCDVLYSAETAYDPAAYRLLADRTPIVLHVMPESFTEWHASRLWLPTPYLSENYPLHTPEVPLPVAADRFPVKRRPIVESGPITFFHPYSAAAFDRNGYELLMTALRYAEREAVLLVRGAPADREDGQIGAIHVRYLPPVDRYWEVIPAEAEVMALPRRYGGASLITQEAGIAGVPTIMLARSPEWGWQHDHALIRNAPPGEVIQMLANEVPIHVCPYRDLAAKLDLFANREYIAVAAARAHQWASANTWDRLVPEYVRHLGRGAHG